MSRCFGGSCPTEKERKEAELRSLAIFVLPSIIGDMKDEEVAYGYPADFACRFVNGNNYFSITWSIDNTEYDCETATPDVICYKNNTHGVLQIKTTASLSVGIHSVQCIIEQNDPALYTANTSSNTLLNSTQTREANLTVTDPVLMLKVEYPLEETGNYSSVKLSCLHSEGGSHRVTDFQRNRTELTMDMVTGLQNTVKNEISFTISQDQEGFFRCVFMNHASIEIGLAALPQRKPEMSVDRYLAFPSYNSNIPVTLSCPIEPGSLAEMYSFQWINNNTQQTLDNSYSIVLSIRPESSAIYQCEVTIIHNSIMIPDTRVTYRAPVIRLSKKVLPTFVGEIEDKWVTIGNTVNFTCQYNSSEGDTDLTMVWKIEGEKVCNRSGQACTMNNTCSVLHLANTSSFTMGNYEVQCILKRIISPPFLSDPSFSEGLKNDIIQEATLTVLTSETGKVTPPSSSSSVEVAVIATIATGVAVVMMGIIILIVILYLRGKRNKESRTFTNQSHIMPQEHYTQELDVTDGPECVTPDSATGLPRPSLALPPLSEELRQKLGAMHMLFPKHHVQLGKVVGQGESGIVYSGCIDRGAGSELVAIKTGKALSNDKERLLKEISIMFSFSHPNVMPLIGLCFDGEIPLIIMPFMWRGTVLEYVKENRNSLYFNDSANDKEFVDATKTLLGLCHQIAKGMTYLTDRKFVHRDLAARNCMIDRDGVIKIADFGLTESMYATNYYHRQAAGEEGTGNEEKVPIRWMAPESIERDFYNEKTDVWSFGVTCWEVMSCGGVPYAGVPTMSLLRHLHSGHRLDRPRNTACSSDMWNMLTVCWSECSHQRPKFRKLVQILHNQLDCDPSYIKLRAL